jgi:endo-beta-N-acetylglucosaminidase D
MTVTGEDLYDFDWNPHRSMGAVINNMAYVAQEKGKLGNYKNIFDFSDTFNGTMRGPESGSEGR